MLFDFKKSGTFLATFGSEGTFKIFTLSVKIIVHQKSGSNTLKREIE